MADKKTQMLDFTDVAHFVDHWTTQHEVVLENLERSGKAEAIPAHGNHMVIGNIGFSVLSGGRRLNFALMKDLCTADSHSMGYPASSNQIKCALKRWLWDRAAERMAEEEAKQADRVVGLFEWRPKFVRQM